MWELISLYREDPAKAAEYLYENTALFISQTRIRNLEKRFGAEDLYNDCFLKLYERLQKSLDSDKDYHEKQVYRYLRQRLRWYMINRTREPITLYESVLNPEQISEWKKGKEEHLKDRYGLDWPDLVQNQYIKDLFYLFVWWLEWEERMVMSMRYMWGESLKNIASHLWKSEKEVYTIHWRLLKRADDFLLNNELWNYISAGS